MLCTELDTKGLYRKTVTYLIQPGGDFAADRK